MTDRKRVNELLAQHLFGWVYRPAGTIDGVLDAAWQDPDGNICWKVLDWAGRWDGLGRIVNAMRAKGWKWIEISCTPPRAGDNGGWDCSFSLGGEICVDWADTAPMAVALAALAALRVDVEGEER